MRISSLLVILALVLPLSACKRKDNEDKKLAEAQAYHLASEARVNLTLRDYKEAEKALSRAVELDPEVPGYWSALGFSRLKLGDKSGAIKAYKRELELCEKAAKKNPDNPDQVLSPIEPLVRLGRADDARKLVDKVVKQFPNNPGVQQLGKANIVDRMLADPSVKETIAK